jgi:RNA polymerase sigma-70 factor (ECF subfamily)
VTIIPQETIKLVRSAQGGDRPALEALFARYLPRVEQIVTLRMGRKLRQIVDPDDIVQQALLKAFQGLDRFEERSEGSFRNWLASCVETEILMRLRSDRAIKRGGGKVQRFGDAASHIMLSSILAGDGPSPSEVVRGKELSERIHDVLMDMPEHHREVIILRHLCEMSYVEIAQSMKLGSEQTARKAVSRALKILKENLNLEEKK